MPGRAVVAREFHKLKVVGSTPTPAIFKKSVVVKSKLISVGRRGL